MMFRGTMLFGNPKLFELVRSAKLGLHQIEGSLAELRDWIASEYQVRVVHIVHDTISIGPAAGRPRLNVILETDNDRNSWMANATAIREDVRNRILQHFARLASKHQDLAADNVHLVLDSFSDECLGQACTKFLNSDAERIVTQFAFVPIWMIDGFSRHIVVFLLKNDDIRKRTNDGTCQLITDACFQSVKLYDEFEYLSRDTFRLRFDSKQNVDTHFNGLLSNYWR